MMTSRRDAGGRRMPWIAWLSVLAVLLAACSSNEGESPSAAASEPAESEPAASEPAASEPAASESAVAESGTAGSGAADTAVEAETPTETSPGSQES